MIYAYDLNLEPNIQVLVQNLNSIAPLFPQANRLFCISGDFTDLDTTVKYYKKWAGNVYYFGWKKHDNLFLSDIKWINRIYECTLCGNGFEMQINCFDRKISPDAHQLNQFFVSIKFTTKKSESELELLYENLLGNRDWMIPKGYLGLRRMSMGYNENNVSVSFNYIIPYDMLFNAIV